MERTASEDLGYERVATRRSSALRVAGGALLVTIVPVSLVWLPITVVPGAGMITVCDAALITLWAVTGLELLVHGVSDVDVDSAWMLLLTFSIGLLAAAGAELSRPESAGLLEFMLFMKKFGLAAVIPLAASRFASRATRTWMRLLTVAGIVALVVFTVRTEWQALLPRPHNWDEAIRGERATGLLTNPNDFAYSAIALAILHCALAPLRPGIVDHVLRAAALGGSATAIVVSGSRSALLGAGGALAFILATSAIRARGKLTLLVAAATVLVVGVSSSEVFQERLSRLYRQGAREQNVSSRLDNQSVAVRISVEHPLGIGFSNVRWASGAASRTGTFETADSVYLDTLMGAGFAGLIGLLLVFRTAWKHIERVGRRAKYVRILHAGVFAFLIFGTATVVPVSVFLSPPFFLIVAGASFARHER